MNKKIKEFLSNHQFYQYQETDHYSQLLTEQIDSTLSKHNQNQICFESNWQDINLKAQNKAYITMDLGGMYLRLHYCQIKDGQTTSVKNQKIAFYQNKTYTPAILFADLKTHLDKFVSDIKTPPQQLVFSFANALKPSFRKKGHLEGEILFWGKNHRQNGLIGLHLGHELETYLRANGYPHLEINVINDSCLAVLSAKMTAKSNATTIINLVVGSGTNISLGYNHKDSFKLINLEFGNLDFIPYSNFDLQLNHQTSTPNKFRTEKLFTGAWQNHLFRIIVKRAVSEGILEDAAPAKQFKDFSSEELENYFREQHNEDKNFSDLQFIWQEITTRGAFICALSLFTIIDYLVNNKLAPLGVTLVEVGALIEHSQHFRTGMHKQLKLFLHSKTKTASLPLEILLSPDPTCEGAATLLDLCK